MLSSHLSSVTILMPRINKVLLLRYFSAAMQSLGCGTANVSVHPLLPSDAD